MSKISPDFIHSVGYLYEEINIQQQDFLNEESEYYDEEAAELVEDILSSISLSMVYEGYSASAIIGFLADSSEEEILEKYLSHDDNVIFESLVDENYIKEQLEILDYLIVEGWREKVVTSVGKFFAKRAPALKSAGPLSQKAAERLAMKGKPTLFTKAKVGIERAIGPKGRKAVQAVKDFGGKVKEALPTIAKYGLAGGLGVLGGYAGAKMAGAGSKPESPKPSETPPTPPAAPAAPAPGTPSGGSPAPAPAKPKSADSGSQKYRDLIKQGKTKEAEALGMQQWAKANPKLAAKLNVDGTQKGTGQSQMEKDAEELRRAVDKSKQRQGQLMGGPEGPGKVDTKGADEALKAQQERDKARAKRDAEKAASSMKESYEPYDIILEYLMGRGHVDTIEEAHYIMLEMDTDAVGAIIQEYQDYVLAEEVEEWVNGLVNEGYDLSEYTWDDMFEYYVTEARVDTGKTDDEKRTARSERGNSSFMNILSRRMKKRRGRKPFDEPGKNRYSIMQHDKKQEQRRRDGDEQRRRDRDAMSRGTWDKD